MRLFIGGGSGLIVVMKDTQVSFETRGGVSAPVQLAQGKQQLRLRRFLLNYYYTRRQRTRHALFWFVVLVCIPTALLILSHFGDSRYLSEMGLFVGLPLVAFGLFMCVFIIREVRLLDSEARRILQRHFARDS